MTEDTFGSLLKEGRQRKAFTQKVLSKALEKKGQSIHYSQISRWEKDIRKPRLKNRQAVLAIADVLEMEDDEKNRLLCLAGLEWLTGDEIDIDTILERLGPERYRKTYFLHEVMQWDEERIGRKLGIISILGVRSEIAIGERLNTERYPGKVMVMREVLEGVATVTLQPEASEYFKISLPANAIWIDSITVKPSDASGEFKFWVFDRDQHSPQPDEQEVFCTLSSKGGRVKYMPSRLELYRDKDKCKHLHCGITLYGLQVRFGLEDLKLETYLRSPVTFDVTLQYALATE